MPLAVADITKEFWQEGNDVDLTFNRTSPTTATLSWNLPATVKYYDGAVIVLSESAILESQIPQDGVRYNASQDLSAPADLINGALVVAALYGDKLTTTVNLVNLDPSKVYFTAIHAVTNTLSYFAEGNPAYAKFKFTDSNAGHFGKFKNRPDNPQLGDTFFNTTTYTIETWDGTAWIEALQGTIQVGQRHPITGMIAGQFFYHLGLEELFVYTGSVWKKADSYYDGISTTSVPGIGTNAGSDDERIEMANILKRTLGWPVVCVELTPEHFDIAITNAVNEYRRRADSAYRRRLVILQLQKDQQVYYLNDPRKHHDDIVEVMKITRMNNFGLAMMGAEGIYAQTFLNSLYTYGVYDLTSIHSIAEYSKLYGKVFAEGISFVWHEASRQLTIHKRIYGTENIVLEVMCERPEEEILGDRYAGQWLQSWAEAELKYMLGIVRSKYGSLPGAGGGLTLNGSELMSEATTDFQELVRQMQDFEAGNGSEAGNWSFTIG